MSDKQLSPTAKAIVWCDEQIKEREVIKTLYQGKKGETLLKIAIHPLEEVKKYLQSLLEEEKKFAEDSFKAGKELGCNEVGFNAGKITRAIYEATPEFEDYYKKYEL